jgi:capsular polysaccharide transport system permease protein
MENKQGQETVHLQRPGGRGLRRARTLRAVFALMLREMSTTYGRSPGGYLWAVAEPVLALAALSAVFSLALQSPPLGESFALFYATGYLPFMLFNDVANKSATSLNYSRPLLQYPAVTFSDVLFARALLQVLTHVLIAYLMFFGLVAGAGAELHPDYLRLAQSYVLGALLGLGTGAFNCYLMTAFPAWERVWQIITRPLFLISGLFLPFSAMPQQAQDILWWNPLIHVVGFLRQGIYPHYEGAYLSALYPMTLALALLALGLLLLWRSHARLIEGM